MILVVDDDEQMRKALRLMLEMNGFDVLEAANGAEAKEVYSTDHPHLVLMDIILPGEHGLEAIKGIQTSDPDARIIAFSGVSQESLVKSAIDAGAKDFLAKPFDLEDMLAAIRRHIK